jgi:glycosyltransferase involved in cell wall biosynthesis
MPTMIDYSIVIPVYNNVESLGELLDALDATLGKLNTKNEIIFVVDGSPDDSFIELMESTPLTHADVLILNLSRNFGSIAAVRTGLSRASGDFAAVMAADLQEPTELLIDFYNALKASGADVAVGVRVSRRDPFISKIFSRIYWGFYRRTVNSDIPIGGLDVFACSKKAYSEIVKMPESGSSLVGLVYWIGFKKIYVKYIRYKRPYGKSAWTFRKKFRYLTDSIFSFSDAPILFLQTTGVFGIITSGLIGGMTFFGYMTGRIIEPGYPTLITTILFSTSMILLGIGIVGAYAWRAFENSKNRPLSIISDIHSFPRKR